MMEPDDAQLDDLLEFLERITDDLGLDVEVVVEVDADGTAIGRIEGEQLGPFIGREGQTIEAIQHLAQRMMLVQSGSDRPRPRVMIDAGDYRARRAEILRAQADDAVAKAESSGRPVKLDAMSASERKVIHEYLRDRIGIETHSEGDEPHRHLVVAVGSA